MALADTMKSMGKTRAIAMLLVATLMIGFFLVLALRVTAAPMGPLYTGLSLEDSAKIVAELEKTGTSYQIVGNGSQILVPSDRVLRLRMNMAEQGIPSGGSVVGYEIFDRSESFGSSNFVMNVNMMRALEGELSRTIGSLANVESARVHLVMPRREIFTRDKDKPSASVTVKMGGGHSLERSEVTSITHLVASAVPGLDASKVTVVDNHGRLLARGNGSEGLDAAAGTAQEFRIAYETRMQKELEDLVEKVIGAGKVRVQVAADINFDRTVTNSEKYDPDGQVARSVQSSSNSEKTQDKSGKDNVSVANNLPGGAAGSDSGNSSNHANDRSDETTNYEISKTVQNHVSEGGTVNKLSVAVLVDGTYTEADGKQNYAPRTEEEIKQLKTLVSSAIGFDEKRGDKLEVVNMRFTQDTFEVAEGSFFDRFKIEVQSLIQTIIIGIVSILAIFLLLRPAVNTLIQMAQTPSTKVHSELAALEGGGGQSAAQIAASGINTAAEVDKLIEVANIKGGMKSSTMKKVSEIVEKYPEETMGVLRQWVARP